MLADIHRSSVASSSHDADEAVLAAGALVQRQVAGLVDEHRVEPLLEAARAVQQEVPVGDVGHHAVVCEGIGEPHGET